MKIQAKFDIGDLTVLSGVPLVQLDDDASMVDLSNPAFYAEKRVHTLVRIHYSKDKITYGLLCLGDSINIERPTQKYTEEEILSRLNGKDGRYYRPLTAEEMKYVFGYWHTNYLYIPKIATT